MCDGGNAAPVYKIVNENFPGSNITTIQRHYFNDHNGLDFIKRLVIEENNSVVMAVKSKYYCLAAASALIKYVEFIENMVYAQESLRVVFQGGERTTMIDAGTSSILELVVNLENLKSSHSLFSVLNRTKTPGGTRLLRSNILQPLNDRETIQARLDCVEELTDSSEFFYGLQSALERFEIDIDHLIASLVQIAKQDTDKIRERRINTAILLKHVTDTVPALCESLSEGKCDLFQAYSASLKDARFCSVSDLLSNILNENCRYTKGLLNMRYQRCFAVKPGISAVLDMSRRVYSEMIEDIGELIEQLNGKYDLPLKSCHSSSRGFHVQMLTKDAPSKLPEDFIQISKTRKTLSFTTQELKTINGNIILQIKDINMITDAMIKHLNASVRSNIGCLYNLSEIVSTLDMLLSFAHYRTTTECVRPEFTDTLAIKNGRHPVLDNGRRCYVPSNVYAAEGKNFNIVTGPNMSGKTTYLKMIAQLQVMAQMGCFVPAEFASFRVASQIFSRVGSNDDMETNSSTFMVEMKEVNYIIQNVTDTSVVIIDELGRGTSSEEGVGLCWAISEFLLSEKAFTFFATHFIELCRMESIYPNIENYHFEIKHVTCNQGRFRTVQFTYALSRGFTREVHYGLDLAEMFDLPPSLIQKAHVIADEIDKRTGEADASVTDEQKANNAAYKFATRLLQVSRSSRLDDVALVEYVRG
uniref:MutS protein homolog 4-like n=1 Tax=Phallusia mammillata TaxID=59560 RepID=A0A6F9DLL6_9ASCI|nr:mutS protein homolog 4-like [Phallusia mammillata]